MLDHIHQALGIPPDYRSNCGMPEHAECSNLVAIGNDAAGRPALLEAGTAEAWTRLQQAAAAAGHTLLLVSAFRSIDYQHQLFQRKLARGIAISDILKVNAAPGFSEHHSGRALDLACPDFPWLEESFERSPAFAWLQSRAADFGFRMSFPRNNPFGVLYEPWHWYYLGGKQQLIAGGGDKSAGTVVQQ